MKKNIGLVILIGIFILCFLIISAAEENNTESDDSSNDTINTNETEGTIIDTSSPAGISLELESNKFAPGDIIDGTLTIDFLENVAPNEKIMINIDGIEYTYEIEDILNQLNYTILYEDVQYEGMNGEKEKTLSFSGAGSKVIGIQIPRYSEVDAVDFSITGSDNNGNYPSNVKMDIGDEGTEDWFYIGDFLAFEDEEITSVDQDGSDEGTGFIQDNETYYCELIDLPLGKDFRITADYEKVGSYGDLYAVLLSVPTNNPEWGWSGGSDSCNLPETAGSCEIELSYPTEGEHLVCIYSKDEYSEEQAIYNLPLDTSEVTNTAFTCPTAPNSLCDSTGFSNFFISISGATYDSNMYNTVDLTEWETFSTAVQTGLRYYIGSEPYSGVCKTTLCNVPIKVTSESSGDITIDDLSVTYTANNVQQLTSTLYDLEEPQADIDEIESQVLDEGATIEIDLEQFDLSLNSIGDYIIEVKFLDDNKSETFSLLDSANIYDSQTLIATAKTTYNDFLDEGTDEYRILKMLDMTQRIEQMEDDLNTYTNQIGFTEEKTLLTQVEALIHDEPWEISYSQTTSDILVIEPSDIPSSLGDQTEVYFMQEAIKVTGTKTTATITTFEGESTSYTFIHKEIEAEEDLEDAVLYEVAPVTFSDLFYITRPSSSSSNVGEFKITLSEGGSKDYYFLSEEELELTDFASIIVLAEIEEEEEEEEPFYFCGDDVCTIPYEDADSCEADCQGGSSLVWIILIIVLAIGIILVINYKDKIFKKKNKSSLRSQPKTTGKSFTPFNPQLKQKPKPKKQGLFRK